MSLNKNYANVGAKAQLLSTMGPSIDPPHLFLKIIIIIEPIKQKSRLNKIVFFNSGYYNKH